jgi:hypothetical protein
MAQGIHVAQNPMICAQQYTPTAWLQAARIRYGDALPWSSPVRHLRIVAWLIFQVKA